MRSSLLLFITALSAPVRADDVSVAGERSLAPRGARDASVPSTVISKDRLSAPGATASEVLRGSPGVSIVESGGPGSLATAAVRGATSAETPVYLAGIRLNDDVGGTADLSLVPLFIVDRAEIYRGHAPLVADRLGIGGAMFFDPRYARRTELSYGATVGSYGQRESRWRASLGDGSTGMLLALRTSRSTNDFPYRDDAGTSFDVTDDSTKRRKNADVATVDVWALGRAAIGDTARFDVLFAHVERDAGVPGPALAPSRRARVSAARSLAAARGTLWSDDGTRELSLATSALVSTQTYDDPYLELSFGNASATTTGRRLEQSAHVRWELSETTKVEADVRAANETLSIHAGDALASRRLFSRAGAAVTQRLGELFRVDALGAVECHATSTTAVGGMCDTTAPSARVIGSIDVGGTRAYAGAGRYVRVPTLGETFGLTGQVRGNRALASETGTIADVGVKHEGRPFRGARGAIDASAFAQWTQDLIAYERSSLGYVRPYNVDRARTLGAELDAHFSPVRPLHLAVSSTWLDPRDTSSSRDGKLVPFRSRLVVSPSARVSAGKTALFDDLSLSSRWVFQSNRTADRQGLVVLPSQHRVDVEADAAFRGDAVRVGLRMANALDARLVDTLGYPLPGRAYFASLELVAP